MQKKLRPEYEALFDRILSGELTRKDAAAQADNPGTFLSWIRSSGKAEALKNFRGNSGQSSIHSHTRKDPVNGPAVVKAYAEAIELALSGKVSARQAAKVKKVSYAYLLTKLQRLKKENSEALAAAADLISAERLQESLLLSI